MTREAINDLLPGTNYSIQVRAGNDDGFGDWSRKFDITTIVDSVVPKTPTNVSWVAANKHFDGAWDKVNKQLDNDFAKIIRYDVELENSSGSIREVVPVTATDEAVQKYKLGEQKMQAIFGQILTTVKFRVRAVSQNENKSAWSTQLSATIGAPDAPTAAVVETSVDIVKLSWTAPANSTNVDGYRVYVGSTAGFTPGPLNMVYEGTATTYTYTSSTYTTQYFKIRSFSRYGAESTDLTASGAPQSPFVVDTTPPGVPTGLTATLTNNANGIGARAAVSWTMASPPSDLAGFWLRYRRVGDTSWAISPFQKDDRSGNIELQTAFVNYEFQIKAVDSAVNESAWSSTYTATSPVNSAPANVTGLTSTAGKDSITYSWTPVTDTDIKNYEVTFSTSSTFASGNTTFFTGTAATLNVGGLTYGTTYYARVRAVDTGGLTSAAWSSTDTETTGTVIPSDGLVPATPTAPSVLGGLSSLYITWSPVTTNSSGGTQLDQVTYEVHLSTTTGFTPSAATLVTEISGTSAMIDVLPGTTTPLSYGTTYYIKLKAKDRDGTNDTASGQGSGQISKVASTDVTSIGADLIVPGTGFIAAIVMNTGGSIQSSNWSSGSAGWKISPTGAEFNDAGSSIKAEAIKAGTLGGVGGSGVINIAAGTSLIFNGGYLKSNTYTGTTQATNPSGAGFYLGNDGIRIDNGIVSASALITGTISGTNTITLSGANAKIVGTGFELSGSGLNVTSGTIAAAAITLTSAFNNNVIAGTTVIDGGKINTGSIQSSANARNIDNTADLSPVQPAWSISLTGAAQFGNLSVLGRATVGSAAYAATSGIQSYNYSPASTGWRIDGAGNVEFRNGTFRGDIIATSGTFSGSITSSATITGGTFQTDSGNDRMAFYSDGTSGRINAYAGGSIIGVINPYASGLRLRGPNTAVKYEITNSDHNFFGGMSVSGTTNFSNAIQLNGNNINGSGKITVTSGGMEVGGVVDFNSLATGGSQQNGLGIRYVQVDANGLLSSSANAPSSLTVKHNIVDLQHDYRDILSLTPKTFRYNVAPEELRSGFIAEEAEGLGLETWVSYEDRDNPEQPTGFDYIGFISALQLVNREQQKQIDDLTRRLEALEG